MLVRAIRKGFYSLTRRYPADSGHAGAGAVFEIDPKAFSEKWMEKVEADEPAKPAPAPAAAPLTKGGRGKRTADEAVL